MRIALVSEHASPLAVLGGVDAGGQNVHVAALARALAKEGHEIVVHTRRDRADLPRRVELCEGVVVDHVVAGPAEEISKDELLPYMGEFAADLQRVWMVDRPDVVHAHFWMSGLASMQAARPLSIPVVQTFHALGVVKRRHQGSKDTSPPERQGIEENLVRRVDHIIATCSDEVFELVRIGASLRRVSIVPCGVDLDLFSPVGPIEDRDAEQRRVVVVSRMVRRKGIGNVIEALADVPNTEVVIAGGPPKEELGQDDEYRRLAELAESKGVLDRVDFRGRVDRASLPALFRSADVVACVPWYEPFGIVPLEAMACGVPVVASAVGGLVDSVVDGVTGVHVPPRDPARLAEALNDLLGSPGVLRSMGTAAAERASRRYGWDRVASTTLDTYGKLGLARVGGLGRVRT